MCHSLPQCTCSPYSMDAALCVPVCAPHCCMCTHAAQHSQVSRPGKRGWGALTATSLGMAALCPRRQLCLQLAPGRDQPWPSSSRTIWSGSNSPAEPESAEELETMQSYKAIFQIFSVWERELGCDLALIGLIQRRLNGRSGSLSCKNPNGHKDYPSLCQSRRVAQVTVAQTAPENASGN